MTEAQKAWCVAWCESHARTWQVFSRKQWKYEFHGKALVRFVDEVKMREDECELILEYLTSDDCIATLSLYDQSVSPEWTPVAAWLEIQTRQTGAMHAVRLYHGLKTDPDDAADGPYVTEDGCEYKVTMTYYWRQPDIIVCPEGSSGIQYRIVNLVRDDEDGSYTYALEKRVRVQQDVPLYLHETDDEKDVKREDHYGVREGVRAGMEASCDERGTKVTLDVDKNSDCTHNTHNVVTKDKAVRRKVVEKDVGLHGATVSVTEINMDEPLDDSGLGVGEHTRNEKTPTGLWNTFSRTIVPSFFGWLRGTCRNTVFRHTHTEITAQGTDPGFTHAEEAGGGVIHEKDVQKTEFGFDVTDTTHTDRPVANSTVKVEKTLGGVRRVTVNRNQDGDAPTSGLGIGDSVTNEKTESGLVDQTIVESEAADVGKVDESCEQNALVHSHSTSEVVAEDPGPANAGSADGEVNVRRVSRTEQGGYRVTDERRTAKGRSAQTGGGTVGRTTTTTHFRNAEEISAAPAGVNQVVEASASPNEFGREDGTVSVTTYTEQSAVATSSSPLESRVTTVREKTTDRNPSESAGDGEIVETSTSPNDMGSATTHVVRRTAKEKSRTISVKSTKSATTKTEHFRNSSDVAAGSAGVNESVDASFSINEFGLLDGTKREVKYENEKCVAKSSNPLETRTVTTSEHDTDTKPSESAEKGSIVEVSASPNGLGGSTVHKVERVAKSAQSTVTTGTASSTTVARHFRNLEDAEGGVGSTNQVVEVSESINEFGLHDGVRRETTYTKESRTAKADNPMFRTEVVVSEHDTDNSPSEDAPKGRMVQVSANPNGVGSSTIHKTTTTAKPALKKLAYTSESRSNRRVMKYQNMLVVFRNQDEPPDIEDGYDSCSPSVHMNDYGMYDGSYHYVKLLKDEEWDRGGSGRAQDEQWDKHKNIEFIAHEEYEVLIDQDASDVGKVLTKTVRRFKKGRCDKRFLYSTKWNMAHEIIKNPGSMEYEIPFVSHMDGALGVAVIYSDFDIDENWTEEVVAMDEWDIDA